MGERIRSRFALVLCLAGALMATILGCRPAGSSSEPSSPNKTPEQKPKQDKKDAPIERPKPEVG